MTSFYLLGKSIGHSKSPAMYNALFARAGLDWRYDLCDVSNLDTARKFLEQRNFYAINVTTPYKELAFESANCVSKHASMVKGANLLVNSGDKLWAYNTDGQGCVAFFNKENISLLNASIVVCGTGPAARSIISSLCDCPIAQISVMSRSITRAKQLVRSLAESYQSFSQSKNEVLSRHDELFENSNCGEGVFPTVKACTYGSCDSNHLIKDADIIIDATTLGMQAADPAPFNCELLHAGQTVVDIVYGHQTSKLIKEAANRGASTFDGLGMLVGQACATARILEQSFSVNFKLTDSELFAFMLNATEFAFS